MVLSSACKGNDVSERALAAALVANDCYQIRIERKLHVEPSLGKLRPFLLGDLDGANELRPVELDMLLLGWVVTNEDAILELLDSLQETLEGAIRLDPGEAVANAILVGGCAQPM